MIWRKVFHVILAAMLFGQMVSSWAVCQEPEDDQESEDAPSKPGDQVLFRDVIPRVKSKIGVPIFVPSELRAPLKYRDARLVIGDGETDNYEISFYYERSRSNANFMGSFSGEKIHKKPSFGVAFFDRVELVHGITGYFHDVSCGGSCAPPEILWVNDGFKYTLHSELLLSQRGQ